MRLVFTDLADEVERLKGAIDMLAYFMRYDETPQKVICVDGAEVLGLPRLSALERAQQQGGAGDVYQRPPFAQKMLGELCLSIGNGWPPNVERLVERLHWALSESLSRARPSGVSVGGVLWREARAYSALDKLNASVRGALRATADCDMHLYVDALRRSAPLFERFRSFGDEGSRTCARRELLRVEAEMHGARLPSGLQYANNRTRTTV